MNKQTFSRNESHLYSIIGSPSDYYAGKTNDGSQVLIVPSFPSVVLIYFHEDGNPSRVEEHPLIDNLNASQRIGTPDVLSQIGTHELSSLFRRIGYAEAMITVRKFFLESHQIGIHDFPKVLMEILRNPCRYCNDEIIAAERALDRWSNEGLFELCLNAHSNRWIDKWGMIESS